MMDRGWGWKGGSGIAGYDAISKLFGHYHFHYLARYVLLHPFRRGPILITDYIVKLANGAAPASQQNDFP